VSSEDELDFDLRGNCILVREKIAAAARRAGRAPESISLVAITKNVPSGLIRNAYELGISEFGESRVQEAEVKISELPPELSWHMVGQLQSNKARAAADMFSLVHSVDRGRLAQALNRAAEAAGRPCHGLLQVNVTGAKEQGGIPPGEVDEFIEKFSRLPYLQINGLMALGPYPAGNDAIREAFRKAVGLFRRLASQIGPGFSILSLGMSADYEIAIEEGSTLVRIGTAIFGKRRKL
jgi:pyridoxal phosphate enzyme (YggS family)